jgi:hypothetical protein
VSVRKEQLQADVRPPGDSLEAFYSCIFGPAKAVPLLQNSVVGDRGFLPKQSFDGASVFLRGERSQGATANPSTSSATAESAQDDNAFIE